MLWIDRGELRIKLNSYELEVIESLRDEYRKRNNGKELQVGSYLSDIFHNKFEEVFGDY